MRVVRQLEIYIYLLAPLKLSAPRYLFFEELLTFKWRRIIAYVNNSVDSRVDSKLKCNFYSMGLYSYAYIVLTHMHNKAYYIAKYMHTFWGSRRNEKKILMKFFIWVESSEIRESCLRKCFSETLQNWLYSFFVKTQLITSPIFISCYFIFSLRNTFYYLSLLETLGNFVKSKPLFSEKWF